MQLRLIRRLVAWATCSLGLISVLYAPVEARTWEQPYEYRRTAPQVWTWTPLGEGHWVRSSRRPGRSRAFLPELLVQSLDYGGEIPNWLRMAEEVLLELAIGGGLLVALRPGKGTLPGQGPGQGPGSPR